MRQGAYDGEPAIPPDFPTDGALHRRLAARWGPLAPYGVATVALYAVFAILGRLISFGGVERDLRLYTLIVGAALAFLALCAVLLVAFWRTLRIAATLAQPDGWRPILLTTLAAGICLATFPRLISKDLLSYLAYGRLFGGYGLNPYLLTPTNIQFDFIVRLLDWHSAVSVYGPVWTLLCTALYKAAAPLATSHIWGYVLGFRVLGLAFHLANAGLIWVILGYIRPRDQVAGTVFYAWNPLVLIEFASNGHNDAALLCFFLAAVAIHVAAPWRLGLVVFFLTLSILTKFITLLALPAYLLLIWRGAAREQQWLSRAQLLAWGKAGAVLLVVGVALWIPFAGVIRHPLFLLDSAAATRYGNSLLQLIYLGTQRALGVIMSPAQGAQLADNGVKLVGRLAFLALWLVLTWRTRDTDGWLRAAFWILFGYLALATPWFWPWYVTWLVAIAAITGGRRSTAVALLFSGAALVFYVMWGNELPIDPRTVYPMHNAVAFGAPLAALWWYARQRTAAAGPIYRSGVAGVPGAVEGGRE